MHFRLLSVFLLLFILAACGGGSGSGGSDSSGEFEVMIAKNQNWLAVTCNKESDIACKNNQMTLELLYREKGSDSAFESFDSGDIEWSAGTAENEYVKLEKTTKSDRFRKLIAIKACPEKNPECVVVTGTLITSKKSFTTTTPFVVKPTEDNLTPTANIDLSLITVDGIKIQGMTDDNIVLRGGTEINLSSSGSIDYDGGVSGYFWDVPDEISSTDKQSPEITIVTPESDEEKIYGIVLNVFDAGNTPGKKNFELTVKPVKPKAYVSSNTANGKSDDTIRLIGSNSTFSEGTITDYQWEQIAPQEPYIVSLIPKWDEKTEGEKIPRGDIDISLPTLSEADAEKGKDLKFRLTVINNLGYSAYKEITIGIVPEAANKAPIFSSENLGFEADSTIIKNHTANEQTDVCIIAEATDSDTGMKSFEFTWSAADEGNEEGIFIKKTETILNDSDNNLKTRVCYQLPLQKHDSRNYTLTIRALDKAQQSSSQTLSLTVEPVNTKPSIVINGDINNETVTITATATDSDGTIKELEWTETGSLTGEISPQNLDTKTATSSFTFTKPILKTGKSYGFTIKATDDEGEEYEKSYGYFIEKTDLTPQDIVINYVDGQSILSWQQQPHATGYRVYKGTSSGVENENIYTQKTDDELSHYITDCPNTETCYYYIAGAYPNNEISDLSDKATFLPAPTTIKLVDEYTRPGEDRYLTIKWPEIEGASSYKILWTRNGGIGTELSTSSYFGTTFINKDKLNPSIDDGKTWLEFVHTEARAIFEEPNKYSYQVFPVNKDTSIGRPSNQTEFYALAKQWKYIQDIPSHRIGAASVEYNGKVYFFGGGSGMTGFFSAWIAPRTTVLEYTPSTKAWRYLEPMETPRYGAAACVLNDKIYITGGMSGASIIDQSIEIYDPISDQWKTGEIPAMGAPRAFHSCTTINDSIYLIGGNNFVPNEYGSISMEPRADYDTISQSGQSGGVVAPDGLLARSNHAALVFDHSTLNPSYKVLLLLGGEVVENDADTQFLLVDSNGEIIAGEYSSTGIEMTTVLNGKVTQSITPVNDYQQASSDIDYKYELNIDVYGIAYDEDERGDRLINQRTTNISFYEDVDSEGILSNHIAGSGNDSTTINKIQLSVTNALETTQSSLISAENIVYIDDTPNIFWGKTENNLIPVSKIIDDFNAEIVQQYSTPQIYNSRLLKIGDKLLQTGGNYYSFPGTTSGAFYSTSLENIGNWTEHPHQKDINYWYMEDSCTTSIDNKIMLFGGDNEYFPTYRLFFDNVTGLTEWSDEHISPFQLSEHSCESLNGKSYIFGGHTQNYPINSSVYEYTPSISAFSNGYWNELNSDDIQYPTPRNDLCTIKGENSIYLLGGTDEYDEDTNLAEIFTPNPEIENSYWQSLPPMNYTRSSENSACMQLNNRLWVFGSFENEAVESLSLEDPTNGWIIESEIIEGPETQSNIFQYDLFDGIVHEGKFYLLGGVEYGSTTSVSAAKRVFY